MTRSIAEVREPKVAKCHPWIGRVCPLTRPPTRPVVVTVSFRPAGFVKVILVPPTFPDVSLQPGARCQCCRHRVDLGNRSETCRRRASRLTLTMRVCGVL